MYDLIALAIVCLPFIIIFLLVVRLLWHAGSWLKRKDRHYSDESEHQE